jgi:hypothetical protein
LICLGARSLVFGRDHAESRWSRVRIMAIRAIFFVFSQTICVRTELSFLPHQTWIPAGESEITTHQSETVSHWNEICSHQNEISWHQMGFHPIKLKLKSLKSKMTPINIWFWFYSGTFHFQWYSFWFGPS